MKKERNKERKIGKTVVAEKKQLIDPRYKSFVSTVVLLVLMLIFFIINNTRKEPEKGPYPPLYNPSNTQSF